jgi:SAM-dependent methyltransferase
MPARYDTPFFDYIADGARASARVIVPLLQQWITVTSVLDVGCGQGAWLEVWRQHGVERIIGIDGDYVDRDRLLIPRETFQAIDLAGRFDLGGPFDLVTCLEVAEHLPERSSATVVANLCRHGDLVLFSAALPGTGGAYHINEQPLEFWKSHFERQGFVMLDCVRPHVSRDARVRRWYRYNVFLFARESSLAFLPTALRQTVVPSGEAPQDVSPLWFRGRRALVRLLPMRVVDALAAFNEKRMGW